MDGWSVEAVVMVGVTRSQAREKKEDMIYPTYSTKLFFLAKADNITLGLSHFELVQVLASYKLCSGDIRKHTSRIRKACGWNKIKHGRLCSTSQPSSLSLSLSLSLPSM